jgi:glucose-1-phosphate adenylyltransferase
MGIYVFNWQKLRKYLEEDDELPKSQHDFGKNILPAMLAAGEKMFAYRFAGYWKDVGTIDSLWESNMDWLDKNVVSDLIQDTNKIYSRSEALPPHYIAAGAGVQNSIIAEGCNVYGTVDFSVVSTNVYIAPGAVVADSIIMPGAVIGENAKVQYAIVGENAVIGAKSVVGKRPEEMEDKDNWGIAVVGPDYQLAPESVVPPKAMLDADEEEEA